MSPIFSIIMCTYNSSETLEYSIDSLIKQKCKSWELIVIDNGSKDASVEILKAFEVKESRIRVLYRKDNIGWCKGISEGLLAAKGRYMMFLGADDYLPEENTLSYIANEIEKHDPDIIWTGNEVAFYSNGKYEVRSHALPEYHIWTNEDVVDKLKNIMSNVYYNSVMHYIKIDFLKAIDVNFFEPFYGDCQGMTEALCRANKMVTLDKVGYVLTINTSQTAKATIYEYNFEQQWKSIRNAIPDIEKENQESIQYIAERVMRNMAAMCENILMGDEVRDLYMNRIEVEFPERFCKIEKWLEADAFMEMLIYAGKRKYEEKIIGAAGVLYWESKSMGNIVNQIREKSRWLANLVEDVMERDESGQLHWKKLYGEEEFHQLILKYRLGEILC